MLPISATRDGRDWMEIFTVLVWATVILIMFLAKLKAAQDVLVIVILSGIMLVVNADQLFQNRRWYKVFRVIRKSLTKDFFGAFLVIFSCLVMGGFWAPHVLSALSVAAWAGLGIQVSPMVSCGLYRGGKNQMTTVQLMLRVGTQVAGGLSGLLLLYLLRSWFPREELFSHSHFISPWNAISTLVEYFATYALIRHVETKEAAEKAK
mmetsp:Transcript_57367/g.136356  ORF Transcript_57367/g.136356 Transcript_57367/m.136356 type:complete len:207 (-) Transcript_57367:174-794(-)